jgi:aspartyl-tRNA synthetase
VDKIMTNGLISMLTSLPDPIVEAWKINLNADSPAVRRFVEQFMDSPEAILFQENSDGAPGVFVYDPRKPIEGLQAFGYEGARALKKLFVNASATINDGAKHFGSDIDSSGANEEPFQEGDLIIIQARPRARLSGGSTALGRLRTAIHKAAVSKGLCVQDTTDRFLWVADFPLFTPHNDVDPGQGGSAGFSSTHHPFTAPKTALDVDLMFTHPLEATADHYDLVLNGVELGGGSRRIHDSQMQQYVMREVLQVIS